MRVAITGSSGLIGTALRTRFTARGHETVPVVRRAAAPTGEIEWDPVAGTIDAAALRGVDAVVNLAGAGIGDQRWTEEYKRELVESRTKSTTLMAETLAELEDGPKVMLSASAVGIYGNRGDEVLDERSSLGSGFLADLCREWEASTRAATDAGIRVVHLRSGLVLSADGGALRKQLPLFKAGLGGRFGKGKQWQSWISIDDHVAAIEYLLERDDISGPVNLTAPSPVTNAEFARTLGSVLRRPAVIPVPAFGVRLVLGRELADTLLFESQRVQPRVLNDGGFQFAHEELELALRAVLHR